MHARLIGSVAALAFGLGLMAGCSNAPTTAGRVHSVDVAEVRRLTVCNTAGRDTRLSVLANLDAVRRWQVQRGIDLFGDGDAGPALPEGPFVMVEYGERPSGGYGIAIRPAADADGSGLMIHGSFLVPGAQQAKTPAMTSPCVLVALPADSRYTDLRLLDQAGEVRARYPEALSSASTGTAVPAQ